MVKYFNLKLWICFYFEITNNIPLVTVEMASGVLNVGGKHLVLYNPKVMLKQLWASWAAVTCEAVTLCLQHLCFVYT